MNAIEIKHVRKSFDGFTLQDLTLALPTGCIMGLVGENGAGKSTTIKLIMNAIQADEGEIFVWGVSNQSKQFLDLKKDIAVVLDEANFPILLNIKQINLVMKLSPVNWNEQLYFDYVNRFKLPLKKQFKDFSRGMKMKLSIAVALAQQPKLLILDEATSGLDPMIRDEILEIFNEFTRSEQHSILISSHIVSDLEKICDYITFIHKGQLVLSDDVDHIRDEYRILKVRESELQDIPQDAIIRSKKTSYGYELLVRKQKINSVFQVEYTTLEDVVLFMAKGCVAC